MNTLPRVIPLCERLAFPGEIIPPFTYFLTFKKPSRRSMIWAIGKIEKHRGVEYSNEKLREALKGFD